MKFKELFIDKSNLLIVNSKLAVILGDLNQAIVINQLNYWMEINKAANKHCIDGKYWVYNSYSDWKANNFPYWSEKTIQRTFSKLESRGIVVSANFNSQSFDKTKWYTISFDKLDEIIEDYITSGQNDQIVESACPDVEDSLSKPIPENTYREYNTENTENKKNALLESKLPNRDKYMTSNTSVFSPHGKPKGKKSISQEETESVIKDELRRLRSNSIDGLIEDKSKTEEWVNKEYNSLADIMAEFNRQYKESTGLNPKSLSKEGIVKLVRSYIKSPESLKYDYNDLESNKVMIEAYLKADYSSYGHVSKSLSHYMSGMIRENLFYKNLL